MDQSRIPAGGVGSSSRSTWQFRTFVTLSALVLLPGSALVCDESALSRATASTAAAKSIAYARLDERTGHVAVLYGELGELPGISAGGPRARDASVVRYLELNGSPAGVEDPRRDLTLRRRVDGREGSHFYFAQRLGPYEVFDAGVSVHVDRRGHVRGLTSTFAPGLDPAVAGTLPRLDDAHAREAGIVALGVDRAAVVPSSARASLGVVAEGAGRLAWRVLVETRLPSERWSVAIDAATGEALDAPHATRRYRDGRGRVFVTNPIVATGDITLRDQDDAASAVPEGAYTTVALRGLGDTGFVEGPYCTTGPTVPRVRRDGGDFTDLNRSDDGFEEVQVYWAIDTAQRYIRETLGIAGAGDYPVPVMANNSPNDGTYFEDSPTGDGTGQIFLGAGEVDDGEDAELVWHEYGHAVLEHQRPDLIKHPEVQFGGAIHEGWSDYLSSTLASRMPGDPKFRVTVAEWDASPFPPLGDWSYLTRVDYARRYPEDTGRGVHEDGQIWSGSLWRIREVLGGEAADAIIVRANFLFAASLGYHDAAAAVMTSDEMLNDGANATVLGLIFADHGLVVAGGQPAVSGVSIKGAKKLIVDGAFFAAGSAVVEVDGVPLAKTKYPKDRVLGGTAIQLIATDRRLRSLLPAGVPVQVTVMNPATGERSAPFAFTR
jgi:hypothetical protein